MGIQSLTSFLEKRSDVYFEKYELKNWELVIDAHSLGNHLYNWQHAYWKTGFSPYCYGGDYDKYAVIVKCFFQLLVNCNVTPYIIFDGCNENDKVSLVKSRLSEKAKISSEITPTNQTSRTYAIGAVALKYAFRDVVAELKLKSITCMGDTNREIACLAKHLKCPVLSSDSDFFIMGSMFIPFSSINHEIKENTAVPYKFIECKLFKIENLTNTLNKNPHMPYLLPALLGNHVIDTYVLRPFFLSVNIRGNRQKMVQDIFKWIKLQSSLEAAIKEILKCFRSNEKKCAIFKTIKETITSYMPISIKLVLNHFNIEKNQEIEPSVDFDQLEKQLGLKVETEVETISADMQVSKLFKEKFIKCQYPAFFLDMLLHDRYLVWPNIEDTSKPDANTIGYTLMAAIHNILVQDENRRLMVLQRTIDVVLEEYQLPAYDDLLPSIEEIGYLQLDKRRDLIFEILELNQNFLHALESLPKEWHLVLLSLKFAMLKSTFEPSFIYSLMICFVILNYVDVKLKGFYRSEKDLQKIYDEDQNVISDAFRDENVFLNISVKDSIAFMQKFVKYFESDPDDNTDTYNRGIMHSIAEFQCVFLHVKYLNSLLNFPFQDVLIYKVFDGTFIYNMTKTFKNKTNLKNYIATILQDHISIYCKIMLVFEMLE